MDPLANLPMLEHRDDGVQCESDGIRGRRREWRKRWGRIGRRRRDGVIEREGFRVFTSRARLKEEGNVGRK